ncbi:Glycyl-radical enzyme activating protein [Petrocella atlantisensis]|uniref:Glycyl-radical enzyme activating protein n=1 Tax=Petrocella atlantisensis TaxID=2173034 RepID=A0A3P7S071_9FIRM|nr:glycyl-radical enzyme activating protein [Petrocella atlantisensis]VDN48286.1 Glycyl-radical enzyme activating protein [Petrocella atlantisensis]
MQESKGMVFNIQKFSLHDGPGIRTVIFFKGCPLHCPWCSNPESLSKNVQITWNKNTCTGCHDCIRACPEKAIKSVDENIVIDEDLCTGCLLCTQICPTNSLGFEGKLYSIDGIMKEVLKDTPFYEESGGGITLSGGEVLLQANFATKLLKTAKKHHIHTAAETTCYTDQDTFNNFIQYLDLLLCDIKHYDSDKHEKIVGVPLNNILDNIRLAVSQKKEIIARIPVIPDFNYSIDDAEHFCMLLKSLKIRNVNLLPYHNYGENKYALLNKPYPMAGYDPIHKDDPEYIDYVNVFKHHGFVVS